MDVHRVDPADEAGAPDQVEELVAPEGAPRGARQRHQQIELAGPQLEIGAVDLGAPRRRVEGELADLDGLDLVADPWLPAAQQRR